MKIIHPTKILYLSKIGCADCIPLILSFAFKEVEEHQRELLRTVHQILKNGIRRTHIDAMFYRVWNDPDNDCKWMHIYNDGKRTHISGLNCVKCGNYEVPFNPTLKNNSIICSCNTFCELYEDLELR
jgi:hypothetical protein